MSKRRRSTGGARPTVATVAAAAGVSTATVSRALAGVPTVDPELARRVREVAEKLGYRPSVAARGLATGSMRNVGVILPDLSIANFNDTVKQMHRSASEAGFNLLIADHSGDPEGEFAGASSMLGYVDGLVLISPRSTPEQLRKLAARGVPIVLTNRIAQGVNLPAVCVDAYQGVLELCSHLISLGHRKAVHIGGDPRSWQARERRRAVEAARAFGLESETIVSDGTIGHAAAAVDEALEHEPTALICFNDDTAVGALTRLRQRGLRVPEDISVTGFDDAEITQHVLPTLTTVGTPRAELGLRAWELLEAKLNKEEVPEEAVVLSTDIVVRESTGPAPVRAAEHTTPSTTEAATSATA